MDRAPGPAPERSLAPGARLVLGATVLIGAAITTGDPLTLLFYGPYALVGSVLIVRRPGNAIGWILLLIAWGFVGVGTMPYIDAGAVTAGRARLVDEVAVWYSGWAGAALLVGFGSLALLFPSGGLPGGRLRWPVRVLVGLAAGLVVLPAIAPTARFSPSGGAAAVDVPNPFAVLPALPLWSIPLPPAAGQAIGVALVAVGAGSIAYRYRRADGLTRLQLRWLIAALASVVAAVAIGLGLLLVVGERLGAIAWAPAVVAFPAVPIAIGIAVLRYRLFELDRLVSRSLAWALVTGTVAAVFVSGVVALETLLAGVAEGQTLAVAAATLVAFSLVQPLRRRVQAAVDRRFDRVHYDAERTVDAFAEQLRDQVDLGHVIESVLATVAVTVRPRHAAVWIRDGAGDPE